MLKGEFNVMGKTHTLFRSRRLLCFPFLALSKFMLLIIALFLLSFHNIFSASLLSENNEMKAKNTVMQMRNFAIALEIYYVDWNSYPLSLEVGNLIEELKNAGYSEIVQKYDAWGREFSYELLGNGYRLKSYGEDGIQS